VNTHTGARASAPGTTVRDEALIARLTALAPALDGDPDPEWQARTRARMVAMAAVRTPEPVPVSPLRRVFARAEDTRSAWRSRLTAGIAGAAAAVTGLASVVALSSDAAPGDALYGVKRGTEQTQLALAGDARGRTLLAFATTRLEELDGVLEGGSSARVVEQTLALMDAQTLDGTAWLTRRAVETGSSAPLDDLSNWSAAQSSALDGLLADVPTGARAEAEASAALLDGIDVRVGDLRPALDCAGGPATAGADELGPRAADCAAPAGPPPAASPAVGGDPGVPGSPDSDAPTAPGAPGTPGTSAPPTDGTPGSGSGSGSDGEPGSGPDGSTGGVPAPTVPESPVTPGLPKPGLPKPALPKPDLPPLVPRPSGSLGPPLGGSATPTTGALPGVVEDVTCTVPVISDC
jgi:Domain of unknown function (DUF5667)